ncbi:unnamed protein product [Dovyalis caffra]|uniref:C2H2-type domain-containing protein n=1 Tax=Dovyalis caffra TaxID=77055 RepID=A0AAV1QT05_9ROSI|nr:unnamed protein product [Dovyalis caffra]
MEKYQEFRHVCKFCSKSFHCGRSLGGHMRSHMINDISAQTDGTKITKKKLPPLNNSKSGAKNNNISNETATAGYVLREKPKKTWRLADHSSTENTSVPHKSCRECSKVFQSWKALFGHMKCHSLEKERVSNDNSLKEQQDSWTSANNQKLIMDSQSDNETPAPNRRKRSKRRIRYMATANSSSLSFANNASSSVSEIEQEQEEVAMCLMMLSRDASQWGGVNSVAESSDNNSVFLETNGASSKTEGKTSVCNGSETVKLKTSGEKKLEIDKLECDEDFKFSASGNSRQGLLKNDRVKKSQLDDQCGVEIVKDLTKETELAPNKCNSRKRKLCDSFDPELRSDSMKKLASNALDSRACKNYERSSSKFECTTCNKVFHSYQALGGHRASHKRMKGCLASRIDSSENSVKTEISPDATADSKLIMKSINDETPIDHLGATDCDSKVGTSYEARKSRGHECPICLKVFPSGQALGGHKRSHFVGGTEAKNNQSIAIQEPIPAIRDFLDLNLPADPVEEESNGLVGLNPWWIGSSNELEGLVGLISN